MDISMPVMNGLEATRYIRESLGKKSLPIVALTAHAIKGDQELFMNGGMNAYIAKPIDLQVFYQTIDLLTSKDEMVKDLINRANGQIENDVTKEELKEFQQELMIYTQKIAIAIKKRNFHDIEELAHYIKTLATTVGDRQVKTWALKIELEARKENLDKLVITFEGLMDVVERLERGLS
jgi:CheY-like chemotaxis protein